MSPSFIQVTVVAGEFVDVQARVKFVVELVLWRLVTWGEAGHRKMSSLIVIQLQMTVTNSELWN